MPARIALSRSSASLLVQGVVLTLAGQRGAMPSSQTGPRGMIALLAEPRGVMALFVGGVGAVAVAVSCKIFSRNAIALAASDAVGASSTFPSARGATEDLAGSCGAIPSLPGGLGRYADLAGADMDMMYCMANAESSAHGSISVLVAPCVAAMGAGSGLSSAWSKMSCMASPPSA